MKCILYFLFCAVTLAETNYVYYSTHNNSPQFVANACAYDFGIDSVTIGDMTMGGIDWSVIRVASFTVPIPDPFTNVNQVALTEILPSSDWKYSIRRTPEWDSVTNSLTAYPAIREAAAADIAIVTDGNTKAALNDLKTLCNQLQDEVQKLKKLIGKNMQVEP